MILVPLSCTTPELVLAWVGDQAIGMYCLCALIIIEVEWEYMAWAAKHLRLTMDSQKWSCSMMLEKKLMAGEVLRDVPKYSGWISASNFGRIYSHPRTIKKHCAFNGKDVIQNYAGRFLSQYDRNGYMTVCFGINGERHIELVSRLILMAFDRMPNEGEIACHNDSNPTNNAAFNLRWDSQTGNMKDRKDRGLYPKGEAHHASKVPVELVDRLQRGEISPAQAAKETGFRYAHLWRIAKGHCWKHRSGLVPRK